MPAKKWLNRDKAVACARCTWRNTRWPLLRFCVASAIVFFAILFGTIAMQQATGLWNFDDVSFDLDAWRNATLLLGSLTPLNYSGSPSRLASGPGELVLFDGHSHSTYSDGSLSPFGVMIWHYLAGYTAYAVTDHQTTAGAAASQPGRMGALFADGTSMPVLFGQEYTTCRCHLNFIGLQTTLAPLAKFPTDADLVDLIGRVHALGGLVVVNHMPWSAAHLSQLPSRQDWLDWGADYFEVANGDTLDWQSYVFARQNGMGVLAGSDMHSPAAGSFSYTLMRCANYTADAVLAELRARRTEILFDAVPPRSFITGTPRRTGKGVFLAPWIAIGEWAQVFYRYETFQYSFINGFCTPSAFAISWNVIGVALFLVLLPMCGAELACGLCRTYRCSHRKPYISRRTPQRDRDRHAGNEPPSKIRLENDPESQRLRALASTGSAENSADSSGDS